MKRNVIKKFTATVMASTFFFLAGISLLPFGRKVLADSYNPGIEAFVNSLYADCLGRNADQTGFSDWCNKLATGQISGKQAAYGFFFSPEFIAKANAWDDTTLIDAYYKVFLNRSADPAGKAYWTQQIAGTTNDVSILFTGFADSTEFASKCASYGITVGPHVDVPTTTRGTAFGGSSAGGAYGLAEQTSGHQANSVQELDDYWTAQGFEIFYIDLGNGASQKCYVRWLDMTDHNNQVNAWRNQNGQPSLAIISDPNDPRYQWARTRAVEVAYFFGHRSPYLMVHSDMASDPREPAGGAGENIHGGTTNAFEAFRDSDIHNAAMTFRNSVMTTAACQVAFVQPDGVSVYYRSSGFYSPSSGTAEATVQCFWQ